MATNTILPSRPPCHLEWSKRTNRTRPCDHGYQGVNANLIEQGAGAAGAATPTPPRKGFQGSVFVPESVKIHKVYAQYVDIKKKRRASMSSLTSSSVQNDQECRVPVIRSSVGSKGVVCRGRERHRRKKSNIVSYSPRKGPNPAPTTEARKPSKVFRNLLCRHYDSCLGTAVDKNWKGFSCTRCEGFEPIHWDPERWTEDSFACEALIFTIEHLDVLIQLRPSSIIDQFKNQRRNDAHVFSCRHTNHTLESSYMDLLEVTFATPANDDGLAGASPMSRYHGIR